MTYPSELKSLTELIEADTVAKCVLCQAKTERIAELEAENRRLDMFANLSKQILKHNTRKLMFGESCLIWITSESYGRWADIAEAAKKG